MRERYQGGSLVGFIIVGILLALVLVGGLYGLNRYNAQKASDEAAKLEEQATKDVNDTKKKVTREEVPASKPEEEQKQEQPAAPATPAQPNTQSTTENKSEGTSAATTANLPQTGPVDTLLSLVAITLLSFATAHYVRSRQGV